MLQRIKHTRPTELTWKPREREISIYSNTHTAEGTVNFRFFFLVDTVLLELWSSHRYSAVIYEPKILKYIEQKKKRQQQLTSRFASCKWNYVWLDNVAIPLRALRTKKLFFKQ